MADGCVVAAPPAMSRVCLCLQLDLDWSMETNRIAFSGDLLIELPAGRPPAARACAPAPAVMKLVRTGRHLIIASSLALHVNKARKFRRAIAGFTNGLLQVQGLMHGRYTRWK